MPRARNLCLDGKPCLGTQSHAAATTHLERPFFFCGANTMRSVTRITARHATSLCNGTPQSAWTFQ